MSKPNINIPAEFAIIGDKTDFSQAKITNGFNRLQPDVLPGDNLNKFIDDTYKGLNGVLELYEGCVLYDSGTTYNNKSLVFDVTNDSIKLYRSLQNGNINHALTDTDYWEISSVKNFDGQWVSDYQTLVTDVAITTTDKTYSLNNYLPQDGYNYEVLMSVYLKTGATSGDYINFYIGSDIFSRTNVASARTRTNSYMSAAGSTILPVGQGRTLTVLKNDSNANGTYTIYVCGYRRIGTNG